MTITAQILSRIKCRAFCGLSGECEYFIVDHPQIHMVACSDFQRAVEIGDVVEFAYIQIGGGFRWMPI